MLSVNIVLPLMGRVQDVSQTDPALAFRYMAWLPAVLIAVFGALYLSDRSKGGYRPESLNAPMSDAEPLATPQ